RPLSGLVFLHAVLPKPGLSLSDQMAAEPGMFNPEMLAVPPSSWLDEAIATRFLFHDCSPEIAHDACARLRLPGEAQSVLATEVPPPGAWPDVPRSHIRCRDDRTVTPAWAAGAARERLGLDPIDIPGGHCPMLSRPVELADALALCV